MPKTEFLVGSTFKKKKKRYFRLINYNNYS